MRDVADCASLRIGRIDASEITSVRPSAQRRGVHAFSLRNSAGISATITQYGGRIAELLAPVAGGSRNVTLGFDRLEPYLSDSRHLGAIAGRYANRIGDGRFILDGREHQLPANDGRNTLHGGPDGFAYRVWQAEQTARRCG